MPIYTYQHPKTKKIKDIVQSMSEKHEYIEDGVKWDRVWSNPQINAQGSSKIDPFNKNKFIEKTGKMKGTYGDMLDFSKELSEERKSRFGSDPIQDKHFDKYEKKIGQKHLLDKRSQKPNENSLFSVSD